MQEKTLTGLCYGFIPTALSALVGGLVFGPVGAFKNALFVSAAIGILAGVDKLLGITTAPDAVVPDMVPAPAATTGSSLALTAFLGLSMLLSPNFNKHSVFADQPTPQAQVELAITPSIKRS